MNIFTVTIVNDNIAFNKTLQNGLYFANLTNTVSLAFLQVFRTFGRTILLTSGADEKP